MSNGLYPNPPVYTRQQAQSILERIVDERDAELEQQEPADSTQWQAAQRLQLLWDIEGLVNNPSTTDDEKWDAIRALLDDNPLLIMTSQGGD